MPSRDTPRHSRRWPETARLWGARYLGKPWGGTGEYPNIGVVARPGWAGLLRGAAPPRPSRLVLLIGEAEDYTCFLHLVDEFLPEHRAEIVAAGDTGDMIGAFIKRFGDRYFPLPDFVEGLSDFVQGFFPPVSGLEEDDYHNLPEGGPGMVLASLLVDLEGELELDSGVRVTLVEVAVRSVPPDMSGRRHQ